LFIGDKSLIKETIPQNELLQRLHAFTHPEDAKYSEYGRMVGNKVYQAFTKDQASPLFEAALRLGQESIKNTNSNLKENFSKALLNLLVKNEIKLLY